LEDSNPTQPEFIARMPHSVLSLWRNTLQHLEKVGRDDDVLQVMRINCTFMPSLSEKERKAAMDLIEEELAALARQGRTIKPPTPIREWTEERIRPRIAQLEAQYAHFTDLWDTGRHEEFPLHRAGQTLLPVHLNANEYIALKQRLAFLSDTSPEHGKEAEGIGEALNDHGGFTHSPDYRSVKLKGRPFTLTVNQAAIIQALHETYSNGAPDMSQDAVIERANLGGRRLRDSFRSDIKAWKALITSKRRGIFFWYRSTPVISTSSIHHLTATESPATFRSTDTGTIPKSKTLSKR